MSTLVLEGELDAVRVVLCGTVLVDRGDREEEDAVVECSDGRRCYLILQGFIRIYLDLPEFTGTYLNSPRFTVVKETLSTCSGFFR